MPYATVTADGELNELLSNEVNVVPGQEFTFSIWARWTDLSYTGTDPIAFGVTEYELLADGTYQEGLSIDLATIEDPGTDSSNPSNNNFIQLTGSYTVPEDPLDDPVDGRNVDQIRMRLKIDANLASGTVDWSDGEMVPAGFVRDAAAPGILTTVDNLANELFGLAEDGWSHEDSRLALGALVDTVRGLAIAVNTLQVQLTPGTYGEDLFNGTDFTGLGADWDEVYGSGNGHWIKGASPGVAQWNSVSPYGARESLCRYIGSNLSSTTNTDYQTVTAVLQSKAITGGGYVGYNDVIGRCDATAENFIRFRVGGDGSWSLSKVVANVSTVLDSGTAFAPGSGGHISLVCGDKDTTTPRHFTCKIGASTVAEGDFGDTTSNFGASYRGFGFGGRAEGDLFDPTVYAPGRVTAFTAQDT